MSELQSSSVDGLQEIDISPPAGVAEVLGHFDEVLSALSPDERQVALGYVRTMVAERIANPNETSFLMENKE